jgi:DNA-binding transcriptional ArsR family regulator
LSDINRLRIISFIGSGERSVTEIVKETNLSHPLVSHHLKTLKNSRLLETKRKGPFIHYKLTSLKLLEVLGLLEEVLPKDFDMAEVRPMFCCPGWWRTLNHIKQQSKSIIKEDYDDESGNKRF